MSCSRFRHLPGLSVPEVLVKIRAAGGCATAGGVGNADGAFGCRSSVSL